MDLTPLLADITELYDAVAEESGMVLASDIAPALPAFGDRDMIQQAAANLLDNAFNFRPKAARSAFPPISPAPCCASSSPIRAPGIPEADLPHATERFFRGETARSTPGSGLGLALVLAVAHLHHGELTLEDNAPGLRAILPCRPYLTVRSSSPQPPAKPVAVTVSDDDHSAHVER